MALVTPEVGGGDPSGRRQGRHAFITFGYQPKASSKDTGSPPWAGARTVSQNGTVDRPSRHSHKYASTQYVFMKHVSEMDLGSARPAKSYETVQPAIKQMLLRESLSATCATNASGTLEQRRLQLPFRLHVVRTIQHRPTSKRHRGIILDAVQASGPCIGLCSNDTSHRQPAIDGKIQSIV